MISFGTKVAVLPGTSYGGRFAGHTGTVCKWHQETNKIGVYLDGVRNPESKEGVFWFSEEQLSIIRPKHDMGGGTWWMRANPNIIVGETLNVKKVIFNGPKTIVIWADGSKTIASCGEGDEFDPYAGFCAAVTKKVFGSTSAVKKILAPFMPEPPMPDFSTPSMAALTEVFNNIGKKLIGGNDNA